jgi:hypothetical protein
MLDIVCLVGRAFLQFFASWTYILCRKAFSGVFSVSIYWFEFFPTFQGISSSWE